MNTQFNNQNRPEGSGRPEGEVVTSQASVSPLSKFDERIRKKVKEAFNIHINERLNIVTFWVNDIFVELEPQVEEDGELIYTTVTQVWYDSQLKPLARLYISSTEIKLEDNDRTLTAKFENVEEDPVLVKEEELIDYLNELSKIGDLDEFIQFAEEEFKRYTGL